MERLDEDIGADTRWNPGEIHPNSEMGFDQHILRMNLFQSCNLDDLLQCCKNMTILEEGDSTRALEELEWIYVNLLKPIQDEVQYIKQVEVARRMLTVSSFLPPISRIEYNAWQRAQKSGKTYRFLQQERREGISHSLHTIAHHFQSFFSSLGTELHSGNTWVDETESCLSFPSTIGQTQRRIFQDELARQVQLNQQAYHLLFEKQDHSSRLDNPPDCSLLLTTLDSHLHYCTVSLQLMAFCLLLSARWPGEVRQLFLLLQSLNVSFEPHLALHPTSNPAIRNETDTERERERERERGGENNHSLHSDIPTTKVPSSERSSSYQPLLDVLRTSYLGILAMQELGEEWEENGDILESHRKAILHAFEMVKSKKKRESQPEDNQQHDEQDQGVSTSGIISREQPGVTYVYQAVAKKEKLPPRMNDDLQEAMYLPENIQIRKELVREMEMVRQQQTRREQEQIVIVGEEMSVEEEEVRQIRYEREEREKMTTRPLPIFPFRELFIPRENDCEIFEL